MNLKHWQQLDMINQLEIWWDLVKWFRLYRNTTTGGPQGHTTQI